jgi:hypothetical protein
MIIDVYITEMDGVIVVDKHMTVYGEFHVDKLVKWRWHLQSHLNDEKPVAPKYPEKTKWSFETDDFNHNFMRHAGTRKSFDIEEIKSIVEGYYLDGVCKGVDISKPNCASAEMRGCVFACIRALTGMKVEALGEMYGKNHSTVTHGIKIIINLIETDRHARRRISDIAEMLGVQNLEHRILELKRTRKG